ncbi:formate dehydrogenase accessory sulfurtransferase FdhD [Chitinophaga varians]|uniref:formate dehydrogenase accessory sulfurtransferase FdhD n=1 Tax=Chitinophaga varians TaxID=2202339 RepID=UPI00165EF187|nr:formate dehydrogenase accessory sulfurtransferase FdhD [Chitinophaga varians]MBC9910129.1 formate dehydrogenase accessory sulfurtransferase FdhD [Chitinophaga varians]
MPNAVVHTRIKRVTAAGVTDTEDILAAEEPLEIRLEHGPTHNRRQQNVAVTMRTPGQDEELATGFLFTEGIIPGAAAVKQVILTETPGGSLATVLLREQIVPFLDKSQRHFQATAACGMCGKSSIENIHTGVNVSQSARRTPGQWISQLPERLRAQQALFRHTGGLHAAALVDDTGQILLLREDIGRHNAVDKIIGAALAQQLPLQQSLLLLSGRAGFELIQKAAMAGIPIIAAIGAPSSMAVKMAAEWNITLIGFLKEDRYNQYT